MSRRTAAGLYHASQVFFDSKQPLANDAGVSTEVHAQLAQGPAIRRPSAVGKEKGRIDACVMDHAQCLQVIVERMADDDSLRVYEGVKRTADGGQRKDALR